MHQPSGFSQNTALSSKLYFIFLSLYFSCPLDRAFCLCIWVFSPVYVWTQTEGPNPKVLPMLPCAVAVYTVYKCMRQALGRRYKSWFFVLEVIVLGAGLHFMLLYAVAYCKEPVVNILWVCQRAVWGNMMESRRYQDLSSPSRVRTAWGSSTVLVHGCRLNEWTVYRQCTLQSKVKGHLLVL